MRRRALAAALVGLLLPAALQAQSDWRRSAVPYYTPRDVVDAALRFWYLPRAEAFSRSAAGLADALRTGCGAPAQHAWRAALQTWVALAAVSVGPLIERRSARRIDFQPARRDAIARAVAQAPRGEAALERIGSPAKGFAALETLLWPAGADAVHCAYALELAQDIAREADALQQAFAARLREERDDAQAAAQLAELVNQWIGGLEQLRLQGIERRRHGSGAAREPLTRDLSGSADDERRTRWQALRALALFDGRIAPAPGAALVPLETLLRGKGLNPLADRLHAAAQPIGGALARPGGLPLAAQRLARLDALAADELAPALDVRVGFSDADGD